MRGLRDKLTGYVTPDNRTIKGAEESARRLGKLSHRAEERGDFALAAKADSMALDLMEALDDCYCGMGS